MGFEEKRSDEIRKTVGMALKQVFSALTGIFDELLADQFTAYFKEMVDEIMTDSTLLFADTIESLAKLKANRFKTAIVTNKFRYRIEEVLRKYDIVELIDFIVGFEDVDAAKPSPIGLLKAVHYLTDTRKNVLYIGDSLIDAGTAVNASIDFAAVTTGTTGHTDFEKLPHVFIAKSLKNLFENIN